MAETCLVALNGGPICACCQHFKRFQAATVSLPGLVAVEGAAEVAVSPKPLATFTLTIVVPEPKKEPSRTERMEAFQEERKKADQRRAAEDRKRAAKKVGAAAAAAAVEAAAVLVAAEVEEAEAAAALAAAEAAEALALALAAAEAEAEAAAAAAAAEAKAAAEAVKAAEAAMMGEDAASQRRLAKGRPVARAPLVKGEAEEENFAERVARKVAEAQTLVATEAEAEAEWRQLQGLPPAEEELAAVKAAAEAVEAAEKVEKKKAAKISKKKAKEEARRNFELYGVATAKMAADAYQRRKAAGGEEGEGGEAGTSGSESAQSEGEEGGLPKESMISLTLVRHIIHHPSSRSHI